MKNSKIVQAIIVITFMLSTLMIAQPSQNTGKQNIPEKKTTTIIKDLNANGIDDAKEKEQLGKTTTTRMRDQFIDTNGDGICDNREQGLGFRRGKMETGKQTGKRQQGRQK